MQTLYKYLVSLSVLLFLFPFFLISILTRLVFVARALLQDLLYTPYPAWLRQVKYHLWKYGEGVVIIYHRYLSIHRSITRWILSVTYPSSLF